MAGLNYNEIKDDQLLVDLATQHMIAKYKGKLYSIKYLEENLFLYYCEDLTNNQSLAYDIVEIEELRNGAKYNDLVHWMARGFRGLPTEIL